ncbi:Alpha/Beta hydrolase protein [Zychaea mexicana]|uniref:Alpha/Beta hydrolase protein n=1 Tax=Zychaea mexicana TaxID=64656 RepID=UPI0022FE7301|nr:Alpha/Beta hydrolase protein [Zychaea mexicana]KAI9491359.1 Alpha/Beta hydrolase protein [Zychaea mexicana]
MSKKERLLVEEEEASSISSSSSPPSSLSSSSQSSPSTPSSFVVIPNLSSLGNSLAGLTGAALLYLYQCELIYPSSFPEGSRIHVAKPSDYGIEQYTEERLKTRDHVRLHTYVMMVSENPEEATEAPTILYFHARNGFALGHRLPIAKVFHERHRCNVVMLSYRGYGFSEGKPNEKGLRIDAQTLLDYVRAHPVLKKTLLIAYGQSIGGAVAIDLVSRNEDYFAGLIVENTFLSVPKLIPHVLPVLKHFKFLCHQHWQSDSSVKRIQKTPVLFLSGACDELVPPTHMRRLFDQCQSQISKDWVQFPNGMHNDTCMQTGYFTAIGNFLKGRVLPRKQVVREQQAQQEAAAADAARAVEKSPTTPSSSSTSKKMKKYRLQCRRKSTNW